MQRGDFGRVDRAATTKADEQVGARFPGTSDRLIDRLARHVLLATAVGADPAVFEQSFQLAHQVGFGGQGLAGEDKGPFLAQAVDLLGHLGYGTGTKDDFFQQRELVFADHEPSFGTVRAACSALLIDGDYSASPFRLSISAVGSLTP